MQKRTSRILTYLFLVSGGAYFMGCFLSSCGKTDSILPQASNIQYQVINLSPDLLPIDLYIGVTKKNTNSFTYPNPSGYFSLISIDIPFQIRSSSTSVSTTNILAIDTILQNNLRYTLFVTGLRSNNSITYMLTRDTSATPTAGRAKIRFVNASPGSSPLDITANGTLAFGNQAYKNVSKFFEFPAGSYEFKVNPVGSPTNILADVKNIVVQDGKIYTMYCRGVVGRTDSAAFGLTILTNR